MRLGTCIALELAVAAGAIGGLWIGVGHTVRLADEYVAERDASAATLSDRHTRLAPTRVPGGWLAVQPKSAPATVFDAPDDALLAPLAAAPVTRVKINRGGTSLSLRIDFANGSRCAFKPEQIHLHSNPRKEIAAYRIDRLLQIGHVQPAKAIRLRLADLVAAADPDVRAVTAQRLHDEAIARPVDPADPATLELRGVASWWITDIRDAHLGPALVDQAEGMDLWTQELKVGAPIPAQHRVLVEQLSTLVVFDVLIDNFDRWSGSNTKASPDGKILYFMDNAIAFSKYTQGHDMNLGPFRRIQKFSRGLVERLRALNTESVTAALDVTGQDAGLGPLLDADQIAAILARRDYIVGYVDRLIAQYGEDAVLAFP
ncbi:MAG TPA: hypothetical protein VMZ53_31335 [Kofleriaceae bacterium]|nr:hypothetical protein [Kofleriaceae bacterium]